MAREEEGLISSEEKYRQLVEDVNSIIMRMDVEGRVIFMNEFALRFFGYSQDEIRGKNVIGTIVPVTDSSGRDLQAMIGDIMVNPRRYVNNENENMLRNGNRVWISWTNRPLLDSRGRLNEVLCVGNDITKLKQAEELIIKAKEAAESASRAKSSFLANMSHELRTPLNAMIGFSELLAEQAPGPLNDKQKEYTGYILDSARHLLALINDILDLSKVEAGKMELEPSEFDLSELLKAGLALMSERARQHGITFSLDIKDGIGMISADKRKVKQVIYNMLSNALKFTPDAGQIGIEAGMINREEARVCVWDTGIGIEDKDRDKVFSEFEQIDSEYGRKYSGTGLGMPLSRRFVELHGGKMWFESPGKGKGTRFYFTLPLRRIHPAGK
ncbi:MAG: ATP-binding protein [Candidatus Omnitrophota bacterium]